MYLYAHLNFYFYICYLLMRLEYLILRSLSFCISISNAYRAKIDNEFRKGDSTCALRGMFFLRHYTHDLRSIPNFSIYILFSSICRCCANSCSWYNLRRRIPHIHVLPGGFSPVKTRISRKSYVLDLIRSYAGTHSQLRRCRYVLSL